MFELIFLSGIRIFVKYNQLKLISYYFISLCMYFSVVGCLKNYSDNILKIYFMLYFV